MHIPVLLNKTIELLDIQPNDVVVDGTLGFGGHTSEMLKKLGAQGVLIGLDIDQAALKYCETLFKDQKNVFLFHKSYTQIKEVLETLKIAKVSKILLDLGLSSYQLDSETRGFSFQKEASLDMRMDDSKKGLTAKEIINQYSEADLERVFREYGELYNCQKFVGNIVHMRKKALIMNTTELVDIIKKSFYFRNKRRVYIKTCAQVFQALRIEVNQEFENIKQFLDQVLDLWMPQGRLAIITFHSLEDKLVKKFIREYEKKGLIKRVNKKVEQTTYADAKKNVRARSAKLRVVERI